MIRVFRGVLLRVMQEQCYGSTKEKNIEKQDPDAEAFPSTPVCGDIDLSAMWCADTTASRVCGLWHL